MNLELNVADSTLFWEAVRIFHGYSTRFVDAGLYVYYELGIGGNILRVHPFVGIGKTPAELNAVLKPMFDELDTLGVAYTTSSANYPTFYALFQAMFEAETAGTSGLTGGWTIGRKDVEQNHTAIIDAFKTVTAAGSFMVGHMWSAGHGLPQNEWGSSAVNPRFRNVVDKLITIVPIDGNAPLADKAAAQQKLTYVVDGALRAAAPNGCAYINEVSPFPPSPSPFPTCVETICANIPAGRPLRAQLAKGLLGRQLRRPAQHPQEVRPQRRLLRRLDPGHREVVADRDGHAPVPQALSFFRC